ncbi:VTT domain-containing protein [Brevibacterium sp.]|uniref:DedA family protein n=1 Tax=Brevibacterium sp. TaxID=1701 RepID=UPI0025BBB6E4|nr:VTT domain-containing protein [Brevibacterium sp.]
MHEIQDAVLNMVGSLWLYPVFALVIALSAAIPPVPSSALIVALGAVNAHTGSPHFLLLVAFATVGSVLGDHVVYLLGRHRDFRQWPVVGSPSNSRRLDALSARLAEGGILISIVARFIPLGRTLLALLAGGESMEPARWLRLTLIAGVVWTAYSAGFGWLSARWLPLPMWAAVGIAIGGSLLLSPLLSRLSDRLVHRR